MRASRRSKTPGSLLGDVSAVILYVFGSELGEGVVGVDVVRTIWRWTQWICWPGLRAWWGERRDH